MFNQALVMKNAPSVFATEASENLSERYRFFKTADVIEAFEEKGWVTTMATQTGDELTTRHMVRMRMLEDVLLNQKDLVPELVISNSHNGTRALSIDVGLFRKICSNGLVAYFDAGRETVRHSGKVNDMEAVLERGVWVVKKATECLKTAKQWGGIVLEQKQKTRFAQQVSKLVTEDKDAFSPQDLFRPQYDEKDSLWSNFNLAQERIMRGGILNQITGRRLQGTRSVHGELGRNSALWAIAEEYAR